jgi:hypothetical protein
MAKAKKRLMSSAPWRGEEEAAEEFRDAKLKVTKQPGAEPVMHVPRKTKDKSKRHGHHDDDDDDSLEIDPQLRYSFQRNYQVSLSLWLVVDFVLGFINDIYIFWLKGLHFSAYPIERILDYLLENCVSVVTQFVVSRLLACGCFVTIY